MKTTSPEKILQDARRRVELCVRRRYFVLFWGVMWLIFQVVYIAILIGEPEAYFHFSESFVGGYIFSLVFIMASIPCVVFVARFLSIYSPVYTLSKRLIELEEERLRDSES